MPTSTPLTPEETATWRSWIVSSRAMSTMLDRVLDEEAGLALIDFELLSELSLRGGARRMCDLGASVALTRSGATRAIGRLERMGLVQRMPSPTDGRSTVVDVTEAGRQCRARAATVFERVVRENFVDIVDEGDRAVVRRASDQVRDSVMGTPTCRSQLAGAEDAPVA